MSIDPKFVEITADVLGIFFFKIGKLAHAGSGWAFTCEIARFTLTSVC